MQQPATMTQIDARARAYSDARDSLRDLVAALDAGMKALQREHLPGIRRALKRAAEAEAALHAAVEIAPELFAKPRTVVLHGVRVGWMKGKGKIEWDSDEQVIRLIRKHLPELADRLIVTTERPSKDGLAALAVADLKRIGVTVADAGEQVYIKPADSALDRMVEALLKAATEECR